jgi:Helix-turn-helix domain
MNQLALEYEPSYAGAILPLLGTQHRTLLDAFYRGEKLTVGEALNRYNIYALSQRVGELKLLGWPISSERVPGKSYKRYWINFS